LLLFLEKEEYRIESSSGDTPQTPRVGFAEGWIKLSFAKLTLFASLSGKKNAS
jgi:hypothetical protein